jgi:hypothetical protein
MRTNNAATTVLSDNSTEKKQKNLTSMDRILDRKLILLVFNKDENKWELPKYKYSSVDDSLREVN